MRRKYIIVISVIAVLGILSCVCNHDKQTVKKAVASGFKIECLNVTENLERCENSEVICYGNGGIGIQCRFK